MLLDLLLQPLEIPLVVDKLDYLVGLFDFPPGTTALRFYVVIGIPTICGVGGNPIPCSRSIGSGKIQPARRSPSRLGSKSKLLG
jgi:hypothetical protein